MNTDALLRGVIVAKRVGAFDAYHRTVYETLWGSGVDDPLEAALASAIEAIDHDPLSFRQSLESEEVGRELTRQTEVADERGVFGVPTFFVQNEMFWGQDRIDFVDEALTRA